MTDILLQPVTLVALAFCLALAVYGFVRHRREQTSWHQARAAAQADALARTTAEGEPMATVPRPLDPADVVVSDGALRRAQAAAAALPVVNVPSDTLKLKPVPRPTRLSSEVAAGAGPASVVAPAGRRRPQTDIEVSAEATLAAANLARVSAEYDRAWLAGVTRLADRRPAVAAGPSVGLIQTRILGILGRGPVSLGELCGRLGVSQPIAYRALAGLLTAPAGHRLVDFVDVRPGNPIYGLASGVRALPRGA